MTEHEQPAPIDEQALSEALGTHSATVRDVAYGEGVQFSAGRGSVRLEIFPRTGVTRLTAHDVRIELFGGTRAEVSDGGVEFSRNQPGQEASLTVVPDGGVVFTLVAGGVSRRDRAPETAEPLPQSPADPTPTLSAPETPQVAAGHTESEEAASVTLQGRLGRDPWFGGSEESPIAGFPLAINAGDRTTWHKVVVFEEAATKLAAQLQRGDVRKGRLVEVTGQTVVREDPTPKGVRKSTEFHATAVSRVKPPRPGSQTHRVR